MVDTARKEGFTANELTPPGKVPSSQAVLLAAMALSGQISSFLGRASATTGLPPMA